MIFYRIGVLNDFKNTHSFLQFQDYGELKVFDASCTKGTHRGFQKESDSIAVFLNFEKVLDTKVKEQALAMAQDLIAKAPAEAQEDFRRSSKTLWEAF